MTQITLPLAMALAAAVWIDGIAMAQTPQLPSTVAAPDATIVANYKGVGAQVYECKKGTDGNLVWSFREPIATLIQDGKTVGRHYAGPTWEDADGSVITAKASGNAPGPTANDIPLLRLDVATHKGDGVLSNVTTVQRLDTQGGNLQGSCANMGEFRSVAYVATYVFLRKGK